MLLKEYRICMPLTVEEYRIGQLYMISKHSHEQSDRGEGVEVIQNEPFEDPAHGQGQFTEKRVYLNSKLPSWARAVVPNIFYVTEKAWNYYPYTITGAACATLPPDAFRCTVPCVNPVIRQLSLVSPLPSAPLRPPGPPAEYTCSFLPKFSIHIETKYEDNKGTNDNIFFDSENKDQEREVCYVDIAYDEIPERYYKESEDLRYFKSEKTSRGVLQEGWRDTQEPIMCSYKLVTVKFEVWGLQTRVEQFVHKVVRDVLLLGHRQAFAWVDEWIDMNLDDVREYEKNMHEQTNIKVCHEQQENSTKTPSRDGIEILDKASVYMTMDEVRVYERTIQEATNEKIGIFPPSISISEMPLSSCALSGPASAPTTPLCTDAPEFLSIPKDRTRKKSAPETLTLPDPAQNQSGVSQGSVLAPLLKRNHSPWSSSNSDQAELGGE
ncbi:hypothetical protein DPEC_G00176430 [Dallia pectoralis]|uniref:Uncharacterized protein n=1 Tax=Dallia pectoralis TaxID=75939 RepID=A0ACC2GEC7_DALPE|nr:hypothetical protein DPEC_G00176430 [Dallia pectoralis]